MRAGDLLGARDVRAAFRHPRHRAGSSSSIALRHLREQVQDPELRASSRPTTRSAASASCSPTTGTRRSPSRTSRWSPTASARSAPHSIVTEDGVEREVDTIIFGTGFHVTDIPIAGRVRGRDGRTLAETWDGSPQAYHGTTVAGFPNLFLLVGPNTGLGHTSIVFMIESQIDYVLDALRDDAPRAARTRVEVRPEVQAAYNAELDRMTEGTVWVSGGCTSYYIDRNGHNSTLWPTSPGPSASACASSTRRPTRSARASASAAEAVAA